MIKIEKVDIYGFEAAIRGMRNPMNSWKKSDSKMVPIDEEFRPGHFKFVIGENDFQLMKNLSKAGNDHAKYLRMINVSMDVTAPLYWWKEFDTYKVGTVANSCSTMHKIQAKEFTLDDFSNEHLTIEGQTILTEIITYLNYVRGIFNDTKGKTFWWQMIQLLPSSYNQKRTIQLNYQVLKNIYHSRKNHKLDEWVDFCKWIKTLPYSELICSEN